MKYPYIVLRNGIIKVCWYNYRHAAKLYCNYEKPWLIIHSNYYHNMYMQSHILVIFFRKNHFKTIRIGFMAWPHYMYYRLIIFEINHFYVYCLYLQFIFSPHFRFLCNKNFLISLVLRNQISWLNLEAIKTRGTIEHPQI